MVHGIVTSLGGAITVETEKGKGSTFHVVLPVLEQVAEQTLDDTQPVPKGSERVLFVDDDLDVAKMASHLLSSLGYEPVIATQTADALNFFRGGPERFAVVITDQVMPGMTGLELARELRAIRADIPVILCSGYTNSLSKDQASFTGIQSFLQKPIVRRALAEALRQAIDAGKQMPLR